MDSITSLRNKTIYKESLFTDLQFDIWSHLSSMETHSPSLQVKDPAPQAVTFTWICLELERAVQGSLITLEKSNSCWPNSREISDAKLRQSG